MPAMMRQWASSSFSGTERRAKQLDSALQVGVSAAPLRERQRGQYHVGDVRDGVGERGVNDREIGGANGARHVAELAVMQRGGVPDDVQRGDFAVFHSLADLGGGVSGRFGQIGFPRGLNALAPPFVRDGGVSGKEIGRASRVPRALLVRPRQQRIQPGRLPAHVPGYEREIHERARARLSGFVRQRFQPEQDGAWAALREQPGGAFDILARYARRALDARQVEFLHHGVSELRQVLDVFGEILVVVERLVPDGADHAADERRFAAGDGAQPYLRSARQLGFALVYDDNLRAPPRKRLLDWDGDHVLLFRHVRRHYEEALGVLQVPNRVGCGGVSQLLAQGVEHVGARRGGDVHAVRPHRRAREFLRDVCVLVRDAGRRENGVAPVGIAAEFLRDVIERLAPRHRPRAPVLANQRRRYAVAAVHEVHPELPLETRLASVRFGVAVGNSAD